MQKFIIYKNNIHRRRYLINLLKMNVKKKKHNSKKNQQRKFLSIRRHEMLRNTYEEYFSDFITNSLEHMLTYISLCICVFFYLST